MVHWFSRLIIVRTHHVWIGKLREDSHALRRNDCASGLSPSPSGLSHSPAVLWLSHVALHTRVFHLHPRMGFLHPQFGYIHLRVCPLHPRDYRLHPRVCHLTCESVGSPWISSAGLLPLSTVLLHSSSGRLCLLNLYFFCSWACYLVPRVSSLICGSNWSINSFFCPHSLMNETRKSTGSS